MKKQNCLESIDSGLTKVFLFFTKIGAALIVLIMLLAFFDTLASKLFNSSIPHATELIQYVNVPAVFLGMAYIQLARRHTIVELVSQRMPPLIQTVCTLVWDIVGGAFCAFSTWRSFILAINKLNLGEMSGQISGFKLWPFAMLMALGWGMLSIAFFWCAVRVISGLEKIGYEDASAEQKVEGGESK